MSRETANAARYAKGLTVLTELEGELLEALEGAATMISVTKFKGGAISEQIEEALTLAHGE